MAAMYFFCPKARLADIRSTGENEFIKSITGGTAAWLGGTDNGTESHWRCIKTYYIFIITILFHFEIRWTFDNSSISSIKFNKWTGSKIPTADYSK